MMDEKLMLAFGRDAGGNEVASAVSFTFDCMKVAEEEIESAKLRFPLEVERADKAFKILCPPPCMRGLSDLVYRSHARELIERVVLGGDTRLATRAEQMAVLAQASV